MRTKSRWLLAILSIALAYGIQAADDAVDFDKQAEAEAIKSIGSFASNIQKNRDGSVRFVRFSKSAVENKHVQAVAAFSKLDYLAVVTPSVSDDGLAGLERLKNLDTLCLSHSQITDATAAKAGALPKLERLYLDGTKVTDAGVKALAGHASLRILELDSTAISDASAAIFGSLTKLETLSLAKTKISSAGVTQFAALPELRYLVLRECEVTEFGALAACAKLEVLDLSGVKISLETILPLTASKSLQRVIARGTTLTAAEIVKLQELNGKIEYVVSPGPSGARDAWQRYLAGEPLAAAPQAVASQAAAPQADGKESVAFAPPLIAAKERFKGESNEVPDFQRHVIPLLGRLGCNGRSCHGSFQGQGGFRLSMFGYDFAADWKAIHGDDDSRVDVENPDESLLIQKPTEMESHDGGLRFDAGGWEHALLRRWIADGAKGRSQDAAKLIGFRVEPGEIVFGGAKDEVQLRCFAEWSNGVSEDVTCLTRFQSNSDSVAAVDANGQVKGLGPGDTHVIAFYDKGVFSIPVMRPFGPPTTLAVGEASRPIDRFINRKLSKLGLEPSVQCTDAEFLRRVSLDLIGTLPTPLEVQEFVADETADKRQRKVDQLLASPAYVEWWTMRLADLTGSNSQSLGSTDMNSPAAVQWVAWLRRRVQDDTGWDRIAAGLILATSRRPGQDYLSYSSEQSRHLARREPTDFAAAENPMHYYWFRSNNQTPSDRALAFSFVFLGVRLECAQCHKHPFDRWSKEDFDQFTQFFTRVKAGVSPDTRDSQTHLKNKLGVPKKLDTAALRRQMYLRVSAEGLPIPWNEIWIESPKDKPQTARLLGGESFDLNAFDDPREPLFEWLSSPQNPYFSKAIVNRIWFQYFGRGLVDSPDDFNQANPASHPGLLDWLAKNFAENGFKLKWLHREIVLSETYQRSSTENESNTYDERNYSRALIRRLPAEVAIDAMLQATANEAKLASWAQEVKGRKIAQHPRSYQARGVDYSLLVFGKPLRTTNCDCERQVQPTLLQSIYRRNDTDVFSSLERADGWLGEVAKRLKQPLTLELKPASSKTAAKPSEPATRVSQKEVTQLVEAAYLRTLSRSPTVAEYRRSSQHFSAAASDVEALRDLVWALLNTREFITNH